MLSVKRPEEVIEIINTEFSHIAGEEFVPLTKSLGRVLARDITADEYVPDFDRSTVDGYAVFSRDTFGCTEAIPAILPVVGEILMGQAAEKDLNPGECYAIPTGGAVPKGADSVVMIEYTEDYGDGTIGIMKSTAPGMNMIFRGDDVYPGKTVLKKGRIISSQDIGAMASMGITEVPVTKKLTVGIISTGDELIHHSQKPIGGQIRDVNSPMLESMLEAFGVNTVNYDIIIDDEELLEKKVNEAVSECDVVILSGGSSVGVKDAACRIIESFGTILLHGIAIKPGKPTILGKTNDQKALVGLPGHPVAAYFITKLFVLPLLAKLETREMKTYTISAKVTENISANHGRAQYQACHFFEKDGELFAQPIRGISGLITSPAGADGYFEIPRDCEGLRQYETIQIIVSTGE